MEIYSPRTCVVIVNYKNYDDTIECLESLFRSRKAAYKVIVVDNASGNESLRHISEWAAGRRRPLLPAGTTLSRLFSPELGKPISCEICDADRMPSRGGGDEAPQLTLVQSRENLGFSGANNIAIKLGMDGGWADHFWLLNNDTAVEPDALAWLSEKAVAHAAQGRKVGITGCKLFRYSHPEQLQAVGGTFNKRFALTGHVGAFQADKGQFDREASEMGLDYIIGASMFVPKEFIAEVGMLDPDYFIYYEEIDWALRGKFKGWELGFCWEAKVYHKEGASIGSSYVRRKTSRLSDFYGIRNRLLITRKLYPKYVPLVYLTFFVTILNRIVRFQFDRIWMTLGIVFRDLFPKRRY